MLIGIQRAGVLITAPPVISCGYSRRVPDLILFMDLDTVTCELGLSSGLDRMVFEGSWFVFLSDFGFRLSTGFWIFISSSGFSKRKKLTDTDF